MSFHDTRGTVRLQSLLLRASKTLSASAMLPMRSQTALCCHVIGDSWRCNADNSADVLSLLFCEVTTSSGGIVLSYDCNVDGK
jgi:hypothetical protein